MKKQEIFVEEVMNSIDGMQRAQAPAHLYEQVMQRMQTGRKTIPLLPQMTLWKAVAAILLLVAMNVYLCMQVKNTATPTADNHYIEQEYFSHTESL